MPIDIKIVEDLEREEQSKKLTPRATKEYSKKPIPNLTHYVVLDKIGKQRNEGLLGREEAEQWVLNHPTIDLPVIQRLVCYTTIPCGQCSNSSSFFKYSKLELVYRCKENHETRISAYA